MVENPDLTGLNNAANENVTNQHIPQQSIKSDNDPVGGVFLGGVDKANFSAADKSNDVDSSVAEALGYVPGAKRTEAVLSAATRLTKDFVNIAPYVAARVRVVRQIELAIKRSTPPAQQNTVDIGKTTDAVLLERIVGSRLEESNDIQRQALEKTTNLLKFHTDTTSTFMQQGLGLQYRQLYLTQDLITLTKALAETAENKLEAIKINTRLPETRKVKFASRIKNAFTKEVEGHFVKTAIGKGLPKLGSFLSNIIDPVESTGFESMVDKIAQVVRSTKLGNAFLDNIANRTSGVSNTFSKIKDSIIERFPENAKPENLWKNSKVAREFISKNIKDVTNVKPGMSPGSTGDHAFINPSGGVLDKLSEISINVAGIRTTLDQLVSRYKRPGPSGDPGTNGPPDIGPSGPSSGPGGMFRKLIDSLPHPNLSDTDKTKGFSFPKFSMGDGVLSTLTKTMTGFLGFGFRNLGNVTNSLITKLLAKKDSQKDVVKKLSDLYSLMAARLPAGIRKGSWLDHDNQMKEKEAELVHRREEDGEDADGRKIGILGKIAKLFGRGSSDEDDSDDSEDNSDSEDNKDEKEQDSGGIFSGIKNLAEQAFDFFIISKLGEVIPGLKSMKDFKIFSGFGGLLKSASGLKGLLSKFAGDKSAGVAAATALGLGSKGGILKFAGKELLKKIPVISTVVGTTLAAGDLRRGDTASAVGDFGSGMLADIPVYGTMMSIGLDMWLAKRKNQVAKDDTSYLLRLRLLSYGTTESMTDAIGQLEARVLGFVSGTTPAPVSTGEMAAYSQLFGFDPTNANQLQYFTKWFDQRFRNCYLNYIAILHSHGYNPVLNGSDVTPNDAPKVMADFGTACAPIVQQNSKLIPTLAGYKGTPAGAAEQLAQNPSTKTTSVSNTTPQNNLNNGALLTVANRTIQNTSMPANNGLAQTQNLNYNANNDNYPSYSGQGFTPSNVASNSGSSVQGSIHASEAVDAAASRAMYLQGSQVPVGKAFFGYSYGILLAAAKAQGLQNPEVIAQLGAAQASLETGYGVHAPGNNFFGIKASASNQGSNQTTREFVNGQFVTTQANFRGYGSIAESAADYVAFLKNNPRYQSVLASTNIQQAVQAQSMSGYATDPHYGSKITSIISSNVTNGGINPSLPTGYSPQQYASEQQGGYTPFNQNNQVQQSPTGGASPPQNTIASYGTARVSGPVSTISAPIQTSLQYAQATPSPMPQVGMGAQIQAGPISIEASLPSGMVDATREQNILAQRSLSAMGGLHDTLKNIHKHLEFGFGPNGPLSAVAENMPQQPTIVPITNNIVGQKQGGSELAFGFDVSKKRDRRYAS